MSAAYRLKCHCSDAVQEMHKPPHGDIARALFQRGTIMCATLEELPIDEAHRSASAERVWQETWELLVLLRKMVGTRLVTPSPAEGRPPSGSVGAGRG